jgi:predicted ATPase/DNA-binding XRE family transcriptional regulator
MGETASFGYWLRRRRKALDLTQEEVARQVGCALITIQKIEADERRPSRQMAHLLAGVLAIAAEEQEAFIQAARGERPTTHLPLAAQPVAAPPGNLPTPPNAFVGRQKELREVVERLDNGRLLTLTGPGGTGKTRLALQVAATQQTRFPDGVYFISLAQLRQPEQLAQAMAHTLAIVTPDPAGPIQLLKRHLLARRLLLLLDNFEHLLAAAPLVGELLAAAPHLSVLATSREPLGIYGEQEYPVPPLTLPDVRRPELWPLLPQAEAVALFLQRAQAVKPDFHLTAANALIIAEICRQVDGLPLALELAAARVKFLTPEALLRRLSQRLATLTGGPHDLPAHQRTLRDTIQWSYDLLDEAEQQLFCRLAFFAGGFTAEAAAAVAGRPETASAILDSLTSLVNKSLLQQVETDDQVRFAMLETIREFALEQLMTSGEATAVRQRHLAYYTSLAETAEPHVFGADQSTWLDRLEAEQANLRAALQWSLAVEEGGEGSGERGAAVNLGLRLAGTLGWYWHWRGHWQEGRQWLESALGRPAMSPLRRARLLCAAGLMAWAQDDYDLARTWLSEGESLARPAEQPWIRAHILGLLGLALLYQEAYDQAEPWLAESLALFRHLEDAWGISISLIRLSLVARGQGNWTQATRLSQESLALYQEVGNQWGMATSLANLAEEALGQGDWPQAAAFYGQSLPLMQATGSKWYVALLLVGIAGVATARGQMKAAAQLLGVSNGLIESVSGRLPPPERRLYEQTLTAARRQLGQAALAAALDEGQGLPPAEWEKIAFAVLSPGALSPAVDVPI